MSTSVHVKNISSSTSESAIRNFFSFCGKITSLTVEPVPGGSATTTATVTFEKESAAKTALLLDNTQLHHSHVTVESVSSGTGSTGLKSATEHDSSSTGDHVSQEDKPRSRIIAEYLAQGYVISDKVIEKALHMDQQHGVSARFTSALKNFDDRFHATQNAKDIDTRYGVTDYAVDVWHSMSSYFDRMLGTQTGQRLRFLYQVGNKQILDVQNEARHLADLKAGKGTQGSSVTAEEAGLHTVEGTDKTKCNCAADTERCPCEPGKCACADCPKNA